MSLHISIKATRCHFENPTVSSLNNSFFFHFSFNCMIVYITILAQIQQGRVHLLGNRTLSIIYPLNLW